MNERVHRLIFGLRSALPISAACVVANGIREALGSILNATVEVALSEPAIPDVSAWPHIVREATLFRVVGCVADAVIVLRRHDALALIGALFGEPEQSQAGRELSPIENDVLDRTVRAMASHLSAVCGARDTNIVERINSLEQFSTYFDIFVESPLAARVGIALSREPRPAPQQCFELAHLADVPLRLRVTMDLDSLSGAAAAQLRAGTYLSLGTGAMQRCALLVGERLLMRGNCGVRDGHYAITVARD